MNSQRFLKTDSSIVELYSIADIDCSQIEELIVYVTTKEGKTLKATNLNAIELLMQTRPSALEGKRLRWAKNSWLIHNLLAHPLMQILSLFKLYRLAFWVHDASVPTPKGVKPKL